MRKIIGFMLIVAMAAIVLANCEAPGVATPKRTPPPVTAPAVASSGTAAQTGRVASPISPPSWIHGRWGVNDDGEVSDRDGWTFTADDVLHEGDWVNGSMRTHSENAGTTLTQEVRRGLGMACADFQPLVNLDPRHVHNHVGKRGDALVDIPLEEVRRSSSQLLPFNGKNLGRDS